MFCTRKTLVFDESIRYVFIELSLMLKEAQVVPVEFALNPSAVLLERVVFHILSIQLERVKTGYVGKSIWV